MVLTDAHTLPVLSPLFNGSREEGKRAVVVGSGVAGVATAFALAKRGYSVAVVDAANKPGDECR